MIGKRKPVSKWWMALIFAAFGYTLAVTVAAPAIQPFLIRSGVPFWVGVLAIPIVAVTSLAPVDPDAVMIYVVFGGSNAVLYGIAGLLIGDYIENHPHYDDKD
jgi:hypothetical protein